MRHVTIVAVEVHTITGTAPDVRGPFTPAGAISSRYLRIGASNGLEGLYGPIDEETIVPLLHQLAPRLIGQDALAGTAIWEMMARSDRHSRHGHFKMAMSAIDNALWDLRGKAFDAPVWQLLGGGTRAAIPVYASTLGAPLDSESVGRVAEEVRASGYFGQKWFPRIGPREGERGLTRSIEILRTIRDTLGPEADVMVDAGGAGWSLAYATAWTQRAAEYLPTWLEEPFRPDQLDSYRELNRRSSVPLAAGEHLYDRSELAGYLDSVVLAAVQCDPEWCGGVTELVRMCAVAEVAGVPVIPHGHGMHAALHVVASQSEDVCPKGEYLYNVMPDRHHFEQSPPAPIGGLVALPTAAGFGIELDESKIESREVTAVT